MELGNTNKYKNVLLVQCRLSSASFICKTDFVIMQSGKSKIKYSHEIEAVMASPLT